MARYCKNCGKEITNNNYKYCSDACSTEAEKKRRTEEDMFDPNDVAEVMVYAAKGITEHEKTYLTIRDCCYEVNVTPPQSVLDFIEDNDLIDAVVAPNHSVFMPVPDAVSEGVFNGNIYTSIRLDKLPVGATHAHVCLIAKKNKPKD